MPVKHNLAIPARAALQTRILRTLRAVCGKLGAMQRPGKDRQAYRDVQALLEKEARRLSRGARIGRHD